MRDAVVGEKEVPRALFFALISKITCMAVLVVFLPPVL